VVGDGPLSLVPKWKEFPLKRAPKSRWIRWNGLWIVASIAILFLGYAFLLMDLHIAWTLERFATALNGAQVNVGSLHVSLFRGECEIRGLEVTDKTAPLKNVLEVDRISFHLLFAPLLSKKVVVEDLQIEGLKHATDRRLSGAITPNDEEEDARPGLLQRVSTGLYSDLRREIGENPFRNIGILLTGMDITSRVERSLSELSSNLKIAALKTRLEEDADHWEQIPKEATPTSVVENYRRDLARILNPPKREPNLLSQDVATLREIQLGLGVEEKKTSRLLDQVTNEVSALRSEETGLDLLINQDIRLLAGRLNLPRLDYDDLSTMVLGSTLLNALERLAYWVDLSRRRMPKGSRRGQLVTAALERSRGADLQFGTLATIPNFLLKHATIFSELSQDPFQGRARGTIEGLNSNPSVYGKPTLFHLSLEFPASNLEGFEGEIKVDHTGETATELFTVSANSVPLDKFFLSDAGDLIVGFRKGHAKITGTVLFSENSIQADLAANVSGVDYSVATHFKRLEESVLAILDGLTAFDVKATLRGPIDKPSFDVKSQLGERLARGIHSEFRPQISAIEDDLRKNILDRVHPQREQIRSSLQVVTERTVHPLEMKVSELRQLELDSSKAIARLDSEIQKHASRRAAK
jgi:uncharacterized protein (TIGR03545 family)